MSNLKNIFEGLSWLTLHGDIDCEINGLAFDSRKVIGGFAFIAVNGTLTDGHKYIDQAVSNGAKVIVVQDWPKTIHKGVTYIQVENSANALGLLASAYYNYPSRKIKVIGITGTNGKTTVASLLKTLFDSLGYTTGLLSTVENWIGGSKQTATHTTPDALELNRLLSTMVNAGCTHCFMEVSSHAIDQNRTAGLDFSGAVFTNITHDHLDYHKTFDAYIKAKKQLFDNLSIDAFALSNKDDKNGKIMLQNSKAAKYYYAMKSIADFNARIIEHDFNGMLIKIGNQEAWCRLVGRFNAANLLTVYATSFLLGLEEQEIITALSNLAPVEGRFDFLESPMGYVGIIDYAHTPDALKNVLQTINEIRTKNEKLITVIGCGGDRDKAKRPMMASVACTLSDKVILTSDNPRTEDPRVILLDMKNGVEAQYVRKTLSIIDREEAIRTAIQLANPKDIILIAGKGHEKYQEINGQKTPFDDKEIFKSNAIY